MKKDVKLNLVYGLIKEIANNMGQSQIIKSLFTDIDGINSTLSFSNIPMINIRYKFGDKRIYIKYLSRNKLEERVESKNVKKLLNNQDKIEKLIDRCNDHIKQTMYDAEADFYSRLCYYNILARLHHAYNFEYKKNILKHDDTVINKDILGGDDFVISVERDIKGSITITAYKEDNSIKKWVVNGANENNTKNDMVIELVDKFISELGHGKTTNPSE